MGVQHPDFLEEALTASQIDDWLRFYELEPFAANSIEQTIAIQTAALLQPHVKKGATVKPVDYLALRTKPDEKIDVEKIFSGLKSTGG